MMPKQKILILGGTADGRELAGLCVNQLGRDIEVISSLAGRTRAAKALAGTVRIGGFGGESGLSEYLIDQKIDALIDATHPFAATISRHAADAARIANVPRVVITRPRWELPKGLVVHLVPDMTGAAARVSALNTATVLVTTGVKGLDAFANRPGIRFVIRQIEDHESPPPFANAEIIVQRPPFDVAQEKQTMIKHNINALVTKESGGSATEAKLVAAQELDVPVVMIERPPLPDGNAVSTPHDALGWVRSTLRV